MNAVRRHFRWILIFVCLVLVAEALTAQPWSRGGGGRSRYGDGRGGVPDWVVSQLSKHDTFTFVRIIYSSNSSRRGRGYGRGGGCWTDYPDSDLNFS